jgi:hypothetical protein
LSIEISIAKFTHEHATRIQPCHDHKHGNRCGEQGHGHKHGDIETDNLKMEVVQKNKSVESYKISTQKSVHALNSLWKIDS